MWEDVGILSTKIKKGLKVAIYKHKILINIDFNWNLGNMRFRDTFRENEFSCVFTQIFHSQTNGLCFPNLVLAHICKIFSLDPQKLWSRNTVKVWNLYFTKSFQPLSSFFSANIKSEGRCDKLSLSNQSHKNKDFMPILFIFGLWRFKGSVVDDGFIFLRIKLILNMF